MQLSSMQFAVRVAPLGMIHVGEGSGHASWVIWSWVGLFFVDATSIIRCFNFRQRILFLYRANEDQMVRFLRLHSNVLSIARRRIYRITTRSLTGGSTRCSMIFRL